MMKKNKPPAPLENASQKRPLRLWPGIIIVSLQWLFRFILPVFIASDLVLNLGVFGALLGGLFIMLWWAFFSRAPVSERLIAVVSIILALYLTSRLVHPSIATGWQGLMIYVYALPVLSLAFVCWALAGRNLTGFTRLITMVVVIFISCFGWILFRSEGISGEAGAYFTWRWKMTEEERLLALSDEPFMALSVDPIKIDSLADWPGFRGADRNATVTGLRIRSDWSATPPVEVWRRPVGPGCSSCAVRGGLLYTQEQRGGDEAVSCYDLLTGKPVWRHHYKARFWDSHVGAGPRGTPTIHDGHIYTLGATGIVHALNARDGSLLWSRDAAKDTDMKDSGWGFSSSPLVTGNMVIIAATGKLIAYDRLTGDQRWTGPDGGDSYSSPHLATIAGVPQILLLSGSGVNSLSADDGNVLWKYPLECDTRIVQPAITADGDLLISSGEKRGLRRISISHEGDDWKVKMRWKSTRLRIDFNDFVIHKGFAYGLSGPVLTCIDIESGTLTWRGARYGGQMLLLADQNDLLVVSEEGELTLIDAVPEKFTERARIQVIEGKTWNHPVLAGDILVVRNTKEMVAYRLPLAGS